MRLGCNEGSSSKRRNSSIQRVSPLPTKPFHNIKLACDKYIDKQSHIGPGELPIAVDSHNYVSAEI
jgi:hypothetical protein